MDFLLDSGAKPSLISVTGINPSVDQFIYGVGGKQAVGERIKCKFSFGCNPSKTFNHSFKRSKIPGESALVLLGLDFLAQFDSTIFDWIKK